MYEMECCLGGAAMVGGLVFGSYMYSVRSLEFSVAENRRVEAMYKELCSAYEGKDAAEFRKDMLSMFKDAKRRAASEGWLISHETRKRLKKDWQDDIDVLNNVNPSEPDSYYRIRNVFKKTGQWSDNHAKAEKPPY